MRLIEWVGGWVSEWVSECEIVKKMFRNWLHTIQATIWRLFFPRRTTDLTLCPGMGVHSCECGLRKWGARACASGICSIMFGESKHMCKCLILFNPHIYTRLYAALIICGDDIVAYSPKKDKPRNLHHRGSLWPEITCDKKWKRERECVRHSHIHMHNDVCAT